ncbi:MAG: hypothetical protein GDA47_00960 [Rhodospirillales bacterium]|nr:hypothetical protein [Rhodospirillales bacterium]
MADDSGAAAFACYTGRLEMAVRLLRSFVVLIGGAQRFRRDGAAAVALS